VFFLLTNTFTFQLFGSAVGVREMGIASINDDISWLKQGNKLIDKDVNNIACHNHQHAFARPLDRFHEFLNTVTTYDLFFLPTSANKVVYLQ